MMRLQGKTVGYFVAAEVEDLEFLGTCHAIA